MTGGPCSGKTSGIHLLKSLFERDYLVLRPPELATLTLESGVNLNPASYEYETHKKVIKEMCQH